MVDRYVTQKFNIDCFHTAFSFNYDKDFVFKGERHDFWEATAVTSGEILMTQEENVYVLGAGDMILHAPGEFHRMQSNGGTTPTGYTISFHTTGELPAQLSESVFSLNADEAKEYEHILSRLIPYVSYGGEDYEGQYLTALLSAFLIRLCAAEGGTERVSSESANEYNRVVSDMNACVREGYDLGTFAKRCNISLSYLKLLFSKYAGVSPKSYYSTLRANEAARLLRGGMTVSRVSELLNFSSTNYFSVFFKRHFGISAQKYKQGHH